MRPAPRATLFPYTTLFRSVRVTGNQAQELTAGIPAGARDRDPDSHTLLPRRPRCRAQSPSRPARVCRSEEHTSELQSHSDLVCRLLLEKKKNVRNLGWPGD